MRRVIKIGVLLMLTALVVTLGMVLAKKPAETVPRPTAPAVVAAEAAPAAKPVSPAGSAAPAAKPVEPSFQPPGVRVFATPPGVPTDRNVRQSLAYPPPPGTGRPTETKTAPATGVGAPMMGGMGMGGMAGGPAGMMSGELPGAPPMANVPMSGMMTLPFYGAPPDPETQKLAAEIQKAHAEEQGMLAKYAATTDEKERTKLKESLSKILDRQFDLQQQMRKRELDPIEARVKRLRELIDKRNQARKTIVEKRLDQLLRDAEGMGWNPPNEPGATVYVAPTTGAVAAPPAMLGMYGGKGETTGTTWTDRASKRSGSYSGGTPNLIASPIKIAAPLSSVLTDPNASGQVEISLGANKGISRGQSLVVYRVDSRGGAAILGHVEVVETRPDRAVCKITLEIPDGAIRKGDRLMTMQVPHVEATKQVKVLSVKHGDASSYVEILSALPAVSEKKVQITADNRTNSLVVAGPNDDLLVVEALVLRLDAAQTTKVKKAAAEDHEAGAKSKY